MFFLGWAFASHKNIKSASAFCRSDPPSPLGLAPRRVRALGAAGEAGVPRGFLPDSSDGCWSIGLLTSPTVRSLCAAGTRAGQPRTARPVLGADCDGGSCHQCPVRSSKVVEKWTLDTVRGGPQTRPSPGSGVLSPPCHLQCCPHVPTLAPPCPAPAHTSRFRVVCLPGFSVSLIALYEC